VKNSGTMTEEAWNSLVDSVLVSYSLYVFEFTFFTFCAPSLSSEPSFLILSVKLLLRYEYLKRYLLLCSIDA
jgi:hypothetical protein